MSRDGEADWGWRCHDCEDEWYYRRRWCPACGSSDHDPVPLRDGELLVATTVHVTPDDVSSPNRLGLARFDGEITLIAQLDREHTPERGDAVSIIPSQRLRDGDDGIFGPVLERAE